MSDSEIFRERFKKLLHEKNMQQNTLAELIGVSEVLISRYVNGTRVPRSTNIAKIANALNVTSDYLLGLCDSPNDAVPVIRCGDCKHVRVSAHLEHRDGNITNYYMCDYMHRPTDSDGFCYMAERQEHEQVD